MEQIKNSKTVLLAVALGLLASACAVGGNDLASGESEEVIATETETEAEATAEATASDDNSLSLGFRPQDDDATDDDDDDADDDATTTTSRGTTTTRSATTAELRSPTVAERQTTTSTTRSPATTAAPTTAAPTTAAPTTADDPTIGRSDTPIINSISARLTNNTVVIRTINGIQCHDSWDHVEIQATLLRRSGRMLTGIGQETFEAPCKDGLAIMRNDIAANPHGEDTRLVFEDVAHGPNDGEALATLADAFTYQVRLTATNPVVDNKSVATGNSPDFIQWRLQTVEDGPGDGWVYFAP